MYSFRPLVRGLVAAGMIVAGGQPAIAAQALRLTDLVKQCDTDRAGPCRAYILGVADGARVIDAAITNEPLFCIGDQVSDAGIVALVVEMARQDVRTTPDGSLLAASYINAALIDRFPCK